jgi:hypothetical protein
VSVTDDSTYRIILSNETKTVSVECFGMYPLDRSVDGTYASVDELPLWIQSKLAVLSMLDVPPPLSDVEGVGSKLSPYLYWVYP